MGMYLKQYLEGNVSDDPITKNYLERLSELLSSCHAGFKSKEEIEAFYNWYEERGEQDSNIRFEEIDNICDNMHINIDKGFKFDELNKTGFVR